MLTELKSHLSKALKVAKGFLFGSSAALNPDYNKHPERFKEDGSLRKIRFFESAQELDRDGKRPKGVSLKGAFDEGTHTEKDSRQVRRRKIRVFLFNHISHDPVYCKLPVTGNLLLRR